MIRKELSANLDDLYRLYQSGKNMEEVARLAGCGQTTLKRRFAAASLTLRHSGRPAPVSRPSDQELRQLYVVEGLSSDAIAARYGLHAATVRSWLRKLGVIRTQAESMRISAAKSGPEARSARAAAAHAAVRGMRRSADDLARRAIGKERTQAHISDDERLLKRWLLARGINTVPAKAVGPYNIDLAAFPVAVEVFGGTWHNAGRHAARFEKRTRYLFDAGWHLIVIWAEKSRYPLSIEAADYVRAFCELAGRSPAMVRQYRVIRGTGEEIVVGCAKDDHFPFKPARERRVCIRCEHNRTAG